MVSLKTFLSNVLLLQPSVFDDLASNGVTDNLQECTMFSNADDWKEVLSTANATPVVLRKLTRLSELISKTSVEDVGKLTTLEEFNNMYTKLMSPISPNNNSKKRKHHNNNDEGEHNHKKSKEKKNKKHKAQVQPRRLCLDDVAAPDPDTVVNCNGEIMTTYSNLEASTIPPPRCEAVARGMLWKRDNKELRFDGKWTTSREAFNDENSPKSEISFWLEEEPAELLQKPIVGRLKTGEDGSQLVPIDSADFRGLFKVQRDDGGYDTFPDDQIVLKFRDNNLGGFNVYGKGRNMIGLFKISGTVASEWCNGGNSSHAELYRTYLMDDPPGDPSSTDAAVSAGSPIKSDSKSNSNSNSFPIGTAIRKFFVPEGETHARPFVGYIIDVFNCDEEIDGKTVFSSQHSILYEDGDVEDLNFKEIEPSVENAKRYNIADLNLTEVGEWESNVHRKYPERAPIPSPGKRMPSQQQHHHHQSFHSSCWCCGRHLWHYFSWQRNGRSIWL
mmetsp:Transcript_51595/g.124559  ORF Transcript_51595/g.124559 Transcript_51595/m.124559 type:complete len:501 (-) Transcript_51595:492-1994(-)